MPLPPLAELEAVARRAGAIAIRHFGHAEAERKADRTVVTAADREVEAALVAELGALLPEAGILGEEGTSRQGRGPYRLVLDPIDGTASFVAGLGTWCVCIGVLEAGRPVAGVVHLPRLDETYSAAAGQAYLNGAALPRLGDRVPAGDRFIVTHARAHARHRIRYPGKVRSLGSTAYHVALVARGAADAALLGRAHVWDLAAPGAILYAVGGAYEYLGGGTVDLGALADGRRAPDYILAGAPAALGALRPLIGAPA
jgi:fructose-1,6-bisphosphatase/inositol monophosphatase family enzyme